MHAMASDSPLTVPAQPARRLVLCLDGTWNSTYDEAKRDDGTKVLKPTNVLKLCRSVVPWDERTGSEQIAYYDIGVGSLAEYPGMANRLLHFSDKLLGGGWGAGFEGNIEDALNFLALNFQPGDEVFIFGFSRGAATARGLTRFLDWAGGLPTKHDVYYLPLLFRGYVLSHGGPFADVFAKLKEQRDLDSAKRKRPLDPLEPFQPIPVKFLGVWDTVMALGSRFEATGKSTSTVSKSFYIDAQPAACVQHARQALAIDEARFDFRPEIWAGAHPGQTMKQRWFAGVHSNVGGGYVDDGLADVTFQWMREEAEAQGLKIDEAFARHYRAYPFDRLYQSESLIYRILDALRNRFGRGRRDLLGHPVSANLSLDVSVIQRMQADPATRETNGKLRFPDLRQAYRPKTVLRFLACQPDLDAYLGELGLAPDKRPLPPDVMASISSLRPSCSQTTRVAP